MKADYINPVLSACSSIMKILLLQEIKLGELKLVKQHNLKDTIAFVFWMTGDFEGRFIFSMRRHVAIRFAGIMIGKESSTLDEMSKSAIAEMASMILGRSGILYSERGIDVKISYPTIIEGGAVYVAPLAGEDNGKIVKVPLLFPNGDTIEIRIENAKGE